MVPGDPEQRTGGYGYVREICAALSQLGQPVRLQGLAGRFPRADREARDALGHALSGLPDGATAVIDGLALGGCPEVAGQHAARLDLIALVHHPLADETGLTDADRQRLFESERRALAAVRLVLTTSGTTARALARYEVPETRVATVLPGVHRPGLPSAAPTDSPATLRILCLAQLSPRKAQHHLVQALASLPGTGWHCQLAGSTERHPDYADQVREHIDTLGLADRVQLTGELSGQALDRAYREADLFVLPSLYEGYGMVIDEALAYGLPVISSDGGALAVTANRPGCLTYPAGDVERLAGLLCDHMAQPRLREQQVRAARESARQLRSWRQAASEFCQAIDGRLPAGSDFGADWLTLREPADHAARSLALTRQAVDWLRARSSPEANIADIGSGTGSNWRYLSGALAAGGVAGCHWTLMDQDASLLSHVTGPDIVVGRLEASNLAHSLPRPLDLITASALIDLVSADWLQALASAAADRGAAVLVVLSYDGRFRLNPVHPADETLRDWVNEHQHGDKGTGAACGPQASGILAAALARRDYRVHRETSSWHLEVDQAPLQRALMQGWVDAARAQIESVKGDSSDTGWLDQWLTQRLDQAERGELAIEVDHTDLLGVPPS